MEEISIVYIDDRPDEMLSRYLDENYVKEGCRIKYIEVEFDVNKGYESLIYKNDIVQANVVIIDSILFENATVGDKKFTGEEFEIFLKKFFPFIEVIVITQNKTDSKEVVSKYDPQSGLDYISYYSLHISKCINEAIDNVIKFRELAKRLKRNDTWETLLKEKIISSLEGKSVYDELTKSDIDDLIKAFKEIQVRLDE